MTFQRLRDGEISRSDVGGGKKRGQNIHALAHSALTGRRCFLLPRTQQDGHLHWTISEAAPMWLGSNSCSLTTGTCARIEAPPLTRSPTATLISDGAGKITSVREPNLIRPTRSPRETASPTFLVKTIRRASKPAICLKTTVMPSPSTVTMFCSLASAEAALMAFPNCPRW